MYKILIIDLETGADAFNETASSVLCACADREQETISGFNVGGTLRSLADCVDMAEEMIQELRAENPYLCGPAQEAESKKENQNVR